MKSSVLQPHWVWDAASGTAYNFLEEAAHENLASLCRQWLLLSLYSALVVLHILPEQFGFTLGLGNMNVKAQAKLKNSMRSKLA